MSTHSPTDWTFLRNTLTGELETGEPHRILYATDASVYREMPLAVAFPRSEADVVACVNFAREAGISITPRAGGTSLAGQAVGAGLVVDVSRYLTNILEIDTEAGYAVVEPGVIRDQLNAALQPLGYWFGPNTSTANRCTLGGMFGNNSCGSTSITVGSTREHALRARAVLSDGEIWEFGQPAGGGAQVRNSRNPPRRVREINAYLDRLLADPAHRERIRAAYPRPEVTRRNNGYALDLLADGPDRNLCTLLAGSEGTLAFTTRLTLRILPLPPPGSAVAALHFRSIDAAMRATQRVMRHRPFQCELMDDTILRLARSNPDQRRNAAFVEGDPRALLLVEFRAETDAAARELAAGLETEAYAAPVISGTERTALVWALRAAGLGILGNMVGDAKAVACIEDTAVALDDLADYIAEVEALMARYGQDAVYYAHAGAGELHLRPVLNLKEAGDRQVFHDITRDVALLVKKYRGSLSGEHGDGRVRGVFLRDMLGDEVYRMLVDLKRVWDPDDLFNPGKIVEAPPMNEGLRYDSGQSVPPYSTTLSFTDSGGILAAAERCNGSGDCRKLTGGAMCPSYRATRREMDSTRGRANMLREVLTRNQHDNPFQHPALGEALDLCLSCKACTAECPSTVDMSHLRAEYLHQRHLVEGVPLRSRLIAANETVYKWGSRLPKTANWLLLRSGNLLKRVAGFAPERSLPAFPTTSLRSYFNSIAQPRHVGASRGTVLLFGDEFSNYQDVAPGRAVIDLLIRLGYRVEWPRHAGSGRAQLSKGLLEAARRRAEQNVTVFSPLASDRVPVIGIEPSAVLGFRDEYPRLLRGAAAGRATELAAHVFTFDGWLARELNAGRIGPADFGEARQDLVLHVHCHEKALGVAADCALALSAPPNFNVTLLDSGCCGMAGSFGYEAEHYGISMQIAEESLLGKLRGLSAETIVVAAGTSCRHQVKDGMGLAAVHPAVALLGSWAP